MDWTNKAKQFHDLGYELVRELPDGRAIGIQRMLYTYGLFVGLDEVGYSYRYCYESQNEAIRALVDWDGKGDAPGRWIKRKGLGEDVLGPGAVS